MGKNGHPLIGLGLELVNEGRYALVLLTKTLTTCRGLVNVIVVPFLQMRILDLVIQLHFPLTHIHLQQPFVGFGIWVTAIGGEFAGTCQRR